jgi:general secretion pathway protein C
VRLPRIRLTAPQAPVLLTGLVWLVAIALSAWILAGWYWRLKAPVAIAAAPPEVTDPIAAAKLVSARHLFGETLQAAAPVVISRYTLLGVAADTAAKRGFAVIAEEGKPADGFVQGEEIAPGVRLSAIRADSVEIDRNGQKEVVHLSDKAGSNAGAATPPPTNPGLSSSQNFMNSQNRFANRNVGTPPAVQPAGQPQVQQLPQVQSQPQQQAETQENNQPAQ